MKNLKRVLAFVLCLAMTLTMLPLDLFSAATVTYAAESENLLTNGGFETADFANWTKATSGTYAYDTTKAYSGNSSAKLTNDASVKKTSIMQDIPAEAGKLYEIGGFFCADNTGAKPFINVSFLDASKKFISSKMIQAATGAANWTGLASVFMTPEGTAYIQVAPNIRNLANATVWFDDIYAVETDSLIANPGFEKADFLGWEKTAAGTFEYDSENVYEGNNSIIITSDNSASPASYVMGYVPLTTDDVGREFEVSAYFRTTNASARPFIAVAFYNASNKFMTGTNVNINATKGPTEWTELTGKVVVPEGAVKMSIGLNNRKVKNTSVWFDAVSVKDYVPYDSNIAVNGGFEKAGFAGWEKSAYGTYSYDTSAPKTGKNAAKLTTDSNKKVSIQQSFEVKGNVEYIISSNFYTDNTAARPAIKVSFYNAGGTLLPNGSKTIAAVSGPADWDMLAEIVKAPENATKMTVELGLEGVANASAYFDNFSVVEKVNLLENPDFEEADLKGWAPTTSGTIEYDDSLSTSGKSSIKLTADAAKLTNIVQYVDAIPGRTYDISLSVRVGGNAASKAGRAFLQVGFVDANLKLISGGNNTIDADKNTSGWQEFKASYKAPEGTVFILFGINVRNADGAFAWFDNAYLAEGMPDTTIARSDNLLVNPGFELGKGSWSVSINDTRNATANVDTTVAHTGSSSFKFVWTGNSRANVQQQVGAPPLTGGVYRFVTWYKTEGMIYKPKVSIVWRNADNTSSQSPMSADWVNTSTWKRIVQEIPLPEGVKFVNVYPDLTSTEGTVWYDDLAVYKVSVDPMPGDVKDLADLSFEEASASSPWIQKTRAKGTVAYDTAVKNSGDQSIRLTSTSIEDEAEVRQLNVKVEDGLALCVEVNYKTENMAGVPHVKYMWYDEDGNFVRSTFYDLEPSTTWTTATARGDIPFGATKCAISLGLSDGKGTVWFDDVRAFSSLFNEYDEPVYVTNVVNINKSFFEPSDGDPTNDDPAEFWNMLPAATLVEPDQVLWTESFFRSTYFGLTDYGDNRGTFFSLPETVKERDEGLPVVSGYLGKSSIDGPSLVIAADIPFNPLMKAHGNYSDLYYPRRFADHLKSEYVPAYVLSGDEYFKERATDIVNFMKFSQYQPDGSNEFSKMFYNSDPEAVNKYVERPEWRGGWDYIYDWAWRSGAGNATFIWDYHSPDHHVCAALAGNMINAYEVFGLDDSVIDSVREFVYYQIPRYGFHSGEWEGKTYYWSEYDPSGPENYNYDAVDNVQALLASVCAMLAYHETDPVFKAQLAEYARGLMWFMIREFESDGRWYYLASEYVESTSELKISHDSACLLYTWVTLAYLYEMGMDLSDYLPRFDEINKFCNETMGAYQRKRFVQVAKVYDGVPEYGNTLKFTSFMSVNTVDLENARFADTIPEYGFEIPATLDVRFSHILPPTASNDNWTIDPAQDVVYTVTPAQLAAGINFPWTLEQGNQYRVTYNLNVINDPRFDREGVVDTYSEVSAWVVDDKNVASFVKSTSFTSAATFDLNVGYGFTEPISQHTNVDSTNFLSFAAQLHFRFEREMNSHLVESSAPLSQQYFDEDKWVNLGADTYIYLIHSALADIVQADCGIGGLLYQQWGRSMALTKKNTSITFEVDIPVSNQYQVLGSYTTLKTNGILQTYIDDIEIGEAMDLYYPGVNDTAVVRENVVLGSRYLEKGTHELKLESIGKNDRSEGYNLGMYHALIIKPTGAPVVDEFAPVENEKVVIAEHDRVMRSTKTKLRLDVYVESDNPYAHRDLTWISSNPEVATVDERGFVTAVANGKTTISAITADGSFADSINITVNLKEEEVKPGFSDVTSFAPLFSDVDSTNRYFDDIVYVSSTGLMNGTGNDKFSPDATITRGMIVTILYRLAGQPNFALGTSFSDVADNAWYASAAKWGSANGIVEGYPNGTFKPNDAITREQLAAIMYRYAINCGLATKNTANANLNGYADASSVSEYARVALNWALTNGVMETYANGAIAPKTNASRGEVASVFHNIGTMLGR